MRKMASRISSFVYRKGLKSEVGFRFTESAHTGNGPRPNSSLGTGTEPFKVARRSARLLFFHSGFYSLNENPIGFLYTSFASQADYEFVLKYAKQLGVVLWENASKRCFFGSLEGHANIRGFIERRTAGGG